jgi:hypothetical protein
MTNSIRGTTSTNELDEDENNKAEIVKDSNSINGMVLTRILLQFGAPANGAG